MLSHFLDLVEEISDMPTNLAIFFVAVAFDWCGGRLLYCTVTVVKLNLCTANSANCLCLLELEHLLWGKSTCFYFGCVIAVPHVSSKDSTLDDEV